MDDSQHTCVRAATAADVPALVELRATMFLSMGATRSAVDSPGWREAAERWFSARMDAPHIGLRVVVERGQVVACAMGRCAMPVPRPARTWRVTC